MPINTTHPEYDANAKLWDRCRDVIAGEDQVKHYAEKKGYLPKLSGQEDDEYDGYRDRAMFYNATSRTVAAITGAIFRKPLMIEPDTEWDGKMLSERLEQRAREAVRESLSVGRFGLLVDMPKLDPEIAAPPGMPYIIIYRAEQVLNWRYEVEGDDQKLTLVVLSEKEMVPDPDDPYVLVAEERYRELLLTEEGYYAQRVWKEVANEAGKKELIVVEETVPLALGVPLTEIPFVIAGSLSCSCEVEKPPLIDLVNVNLSHFRTSADLEHGRHFTALPTAWVAGFGNDQELRIGSGTAWVTDNPAAHAGFLEFTGAGLGALSEGMVQKEHLMAVLGARLFEPPRAGVEAAETLRLRQSADTATAGGIARVCSEAFTRGLRWMMQFVRGGEPEMARCEINSDVLDIPMDLGTLTALMTLWQNGAISYETMLYQLKEGEIIPADRSIEDEKSLIADDDARFAAGGFRFSPPPPEEAGNQSPQPKPKSKGRPA